MCYRKNKSKQQTEPSALHASYGELLNVVINLVTFARSAGSGGDVRTIHIYIPEDCTARYR